MQRRQFLKQSSIVSLGFLGLSRCTLLGKENLSEQFRYGPLLKDPNEYLDLPKGFSYKIISKAGDQMHDGLIVPGFADGMATFPGSGANVLLLRNHEISPGSSKFGAFGKNYELLDMLNPSDFYDFGNGETPSLGGVSTVVYNEAKGLVELEYMSLAGTNRNCAGGPTPWGSWISCEEDVSKVQDKMEKDHGYNFEVPARESIFRAKPLPLTDMGRFNHEAICVDPRTSIVYQTEDRGDSLIYRFLPNAKEHLHKGGRLQVLCVVGQPSLDTRNWRKRTVELATPLEVQWLDIDDVESPEDDLRLRGFENGAACFARGEGMWFGNEELFFACTSGGPKKLGQVFKYIPSPYEGTDREQEKPGQLILFAESKSKNILRNCDNLTIAPWGDVILCEDTTDAYLRGITPEGQIYTLGHNVGSTSEFAGVTFSPSGKTLFVNIQGPGHTLAITGPWDKLAVL